MKMMRPILVVFRALATASICLAQSIAGDMVQSRLLNELSEGGMPLLAATSADGSFLTRQATRVKQTASRHPVQISIIVLACVLCIALLAVLVWQWAAELAAWRRRVRRLEQDEACKAHLEGMELEEIDLESPTKSSPMPGVDSWATPTATPGRSPPPSPEPRPGVERPEVRPAPPIVRLPGSALVRRTPSLRSELLARAVGSPRLGRTRSGSPSSPLGRAGSGSGRLAALPVARTASNLSASSAGGSAASPQTSDLTVDPSVRARDISQMGWAPNPHAARSPPGSTPATPLSATEPYSFTPQLEYRLSTAAPAASEPVLADDSAPSSQLGSPSEASSSTGLPAQAARGAKEVLPGGKNLLRATTDGGLVDFRLSTRVTDDPEQAPGGADGAVLMLQQEQRRTSSGERAGGLHTARSIKPRDLAPPPEEAEHSQSPSAAEAAMRALPPLRLAPPPLSVLSGVPILTPEQFDAEVSLVRVLGAGGAGSVHEGTWRGRPVAVKILHPSRQASINAVGAFRREVDLMARIGAHPNVVAVLAACLDPPCMSIVQELAERGSLHAALHDEGLRPQYGALLQLAEDVASALAHCHSLSPPLVHRDLKTHNVLLGADGRARVADFGLAAAKHRTFLTVENGALGTACVMAPEQFAAGQVDERCDSYAYGCLLWECLTGRQPWQELDNIMQIVMAVGCEKRRPPMPADCPPALARLIRECWRHNAAARPRFAEILVRIRKMKEAAAAGAAEEAAAAAELAAAPSSARRLRRGPYNVFTPAQASSIGRETRLAGGPQGHSADVELALRTI